MRQEEFGVRVLVCGSRNLWDYWFVDQLLTRIQHNGENRKVIEVAEGGATGIDACAAAWAITNDVPLKTYNADWKRFGPAAGPMRNMRMLREFDPDLVVAFPGGKGTRNMVNLARAAGVQVLEARYEQLVPEEM